LADAEVDRYLTAIMTGFFGDLSTVSTWVGEISKLVPRHRQYLYTMGTLIIAQVVGLAIYGPPYWTQR